MQSQNNGVEKPLGTREWYNFVGMLTDALPYVHVGGEEATRALLDVLPMESAGRVLDVGCGPGGTACYIAKHYGTRVYGIDIAEVMIEKAKARAHRLGVVDDVDFRVADAFELPFEDDFFDGALLESVLTPMSGDKQAALTELRRVVKPGGWIAANEATVDPDAPPEFTHAMRAHPAFYGYFTTKTLRNLFESANLRVTYFHEFNQVAAPNVMKEMGCRGLITFMFKVYPSLVLRLLRDAKLRQARVLDEQITKQSGEYTGYALIVGEKS